MSMTKSNGDASTKWDICISIVAVDDADTGKLSALFMISVRTLHYSSIETTGMKASINHSTSRPQCTR